MLTKFQDWLSEGTLQPVKLETPAEHLARFDARAKELRDAMGARHLLHPANQVKRLDGRTFRPEPATNIRRIRKVQAA